MFGITLKMLVGNRASCIGVVFGIFLATLLISQQSSIFLGLISRSYRLLSDTPAPNIWVINPASESDDKFKTISTGYVDAVRSTPGVEWASLLSRTPATLMTPSGTFQVCEIYGLDDATLIGAPEEIVEGSLWNIREPGGVIIDQRSAEDLLAKTVEGGKKVPLTVGDHFEINGVHAIVVGISKMTPGFYPLPLIYTTYSQFQYFSPSAPGHTTYILAKASQAHLKEVLQEINRIPGILALSEGQFKRKISDSFLKTGILINFGLSVALGIIIGFSIAGQIFYVMTMQNIKYYALIKSLGGSNQLLLRMILLKVFLLGFNGFFIGIGTTLLWGFATKGTTLAFLFNWEILAITGLLVVIICVFTTGFSMKKIMEADPVLLMNGS